MFYVDHCGYSRFTRTAAIARAKEISKEFPNYSIAIWTRENRGEDLTIFASYKNGELED